MRHPLSPLPLALSDRICHLTICDRQCMPHPLGELSRPRAGVGRYDSNGHGGSSESD
jgi:hypothetical protein